MISIRTKKDSKTVDNVAEKSVSRFRRVVGRKGELGISHINRKRIDIFARPQGDSRDEAMKRINGT